MALRRLDREAFIAEVLPALRRIFLVYDTPREGNLQANVEAPFQREVSERGFLGQFPTELEDPQLQSVMKVARAIGDIGMYFWFHEAGYSEESLEQWPACFIPLASDDDEADFLRFYEKNYPGGIGAALLSATGRWGAVNYGDPSFSIVGGPTGFVTAVYAELGTTAQAQALTFLRGWEGGSWLENHERHSWVPELLAHLFGEKQALRFIAEAERLASENQPPQR